jgi:hypothetical protein
VERLRPLPAVALARRSSRPAGAGRPPSSRPNHTYTVSRPGTGNWLTERG